jgi:TatD DNase family protein
VSQIINVAYDSPSILLAQEQLKSSKMLFAALGIQPHSAADFTHEEAENVKKIAFTNERVVAIGEIGLDAYHNLCPLEKQIECFESFLHVAVETKLPVIIHVRKTHQEVYERIKKFSQQYALTGVIHCFTGTLEEAKDFLSCGMFLSFSGIVTFKNAQKLKEVVQYIPEDRLLIETDSPYLAPVPLRGKTNEPAHLFYISRHIAQLRGLADEELSQITSKNAQRLFCRLVQKTVSL